MNRNQKHPTADLYFAGLDREGAEVWKSKSSKGRGQGRPGAPRKIDAQGLERVRALYSAGKPSGAKIEALARALGVSARTIRRRGAASPQVIRDRQAAAMLFVEAVRHNPALMPKAVRKVAQKLKQSERTARRFIKRALKL